MALVESTKINIGTKMPHIILNDTGGISFNSENYIGKKGLLIVFTCNHCPYAIAIWERVLKCARFGKENEITSLFINPNIHPDYPEDSPSNMRKKIIEWNIDQPYLIDEKQEIAKKYQAQCTPDIYLLDNNHSLFYHGRLDDNWKKPDCVTKHELKEAMNDLIGNKRPPSQQIPSMGCSIKWEN